MRNIKYIALMIVLIILVGGAFWISDRYKLDDSWEEEVEEEIKSLFQDLESETRIDFPEITSLELKWNIKDEEGLRAIDVNGGGFEMQGIAADQQKEIESFLQNQGFEVDLYNVADGTVGGLVGYRKEQVVCTVSSISQLDDAGMPLSSGLMDLKMVCGKADITIQPVSSGSTEVVKQLFAEKYNTKNSAVAIVISQEAENHIRGTFDILDERVEKESGKSGTFLVTKVDDAWLLVFDEDRMIFCEEIEEYNFPEEMIVDCERIMGTTINVNNGDSFIVAFGSNPTTGYEWEAKFDLDYLELAEQKYTPYADESVVGAGGNETFEFLALKHGETEIEFSYLRSWEEEQEPLREATYTVIIKQN